MKVSDITKRVLAARREQRDLEQRGYRKHATDWEIHRGTKTAYVITDAKISVCGKYVYTKITEGLV